VLLRVARSALRRFERSGDLSPQVLTQSFFIKIRFAWLGVGTVVALWLVERITAKETAMYQVQIYAIAQTLWRWEIRCGGALLCCGTAHSQVDAENEVRETIDA
jgi:hypothetical protein